MSAAVAGGGAYLNNATYHKGAVEMLYNAFMILYLSVYLQTHQQKLCETIEKEVFLFFI